MHQALDVAPANIALEAEVTDTVDNVNHGTGIEVARLGMTDNLAIDTILCRKRESEQSNLVQVRIAAHRTDETGGSH